MGIALGTPACGQVPGTTDIKSASRAEAATTDIITASPATAAPTGTVTIAVEATNGAGCAHGTVGVVVASDNTAFNITYSDYLAQVGGGSEPIDFRTNCQVNLKVQVPKGYTYAVSSADYRGYAQLETGATGILKASFYFQGSPVITPVFHTWLGPYSEDWQATDSVPWELLTYAPCGEQRNLNITTELTVNAGSSDPSRTTSFMTMDSTDDAVNAIYHLAWRKCPAA